MPRNAVDTFRIGHTVVALHSSDAVLRRLFRDHWGAFRLPAGLRRRTAGVIRCTTPPQHLARRLKTWQSYVSSRFVVLTDGKRYVLTANLETAPWQVDCRALARWDAAFVYYHVLEPLLLDLLKQAGLLVWHGGAVAKNGQAVLLVGPSGSGKSTTAVNLVARGYQLVADDMVLLRATPGGVEVIGWERAVFLTSDALARLPEWRRAAAGGRYKRGREWKHRIELARGRVHVARPRLVRTLLFPTVDKSGRTALRRLSAAEALVECLRQPPKEFPATVLPSALSRQFEVLDRLVRTSRCYRLYLGRDQDQVRDALARLG